MVRTLIASQPVLMLTAIGHLALAGLFAAGAWMDSRVVLGINVWVKPMKFGVSIAVFLATMAMILWALPRTRLTQGAAAVMAATMVIETTMIVLQSWRGVPSHFNVATPFDGAIFSIMGIAIAVNTLAVAAVTVTLFTSPPTMSTPLLWSLRLGLIVFLLGSAQGAMMASRLSHSVGVPDGGPGLPFLNWSTIAGDLRVAHFVGLHALQVLPLVGLAATRFAPTPSIGLAAVLLAAGAHFWLLAWTFVRALAARPLFPLG